jgi:hypothetical protein
VVDIGVLLGASCTSVLSAAQLYCLLLDCTACLVLLLLCVAWQGDDARQAPAGQEPGSSSSSSKSSRGAGSLGPVRASLPRGRSWAGLTLDEALQLLALPHTVSCRTSHSMTEGYTRLSVCHTCCYMLCTYMHSISFVTFVDMPARSSRSCVCGVVVDTYL